jgi:hypothetical protein
MTKDGCGLIECPNPAAEPVCCDNCATLQQENAQLRSWLKALQIVYAEENSRMYLALRDALKGCIVPPGLADAITAPVTALRADLDAQFVEIARLQDENERLMQAANLKRTRPKSVLRTAKH